jgi:hypothetical protein
MSTVTQSEPRITSVKVTKKAIVAHLADGRIVSVPLEWSWRLSGAAPEERARWEIIGDGQGIHWPDVDEDISLHGMLRGVPAKRPSRWPRRQGDRRKRIAAQELLSIIDRSDYLDYFKQAALRPQEPMTYQP